MQWCAGAVQLYAMLSWSSGGSSLTSVLAFAGWYSLVCVPRTVRGLCVGAPVWGSKQEVGVQLVLLSTTWALPELGVVLLGCYSVLAPVPEDVQLARKGRQT